MSARERLLVVVQRYGTEIVGGAETHARLVAEHLAPHLDVEVATTTALDYWTWRNHYEPGDTQVHGIPVHRFPNVRERARDFQTFSRHVLQEAHTLEEEQRWIRDQGPECPAILEFLHRRGREYDYVLFFNYLYYPTLYGLPMVPERALLMPAAHDEPAIRLSSYRAIFHLPRAFPYNTEEERDLVHRLFGNQRVPYDIVGVGVDAPAEAPSAQRFRAAHGVERPFLLYFGRIVESKGVDELLDFFTRMKDAPGAPAIDLVLAGKAEMAIPRRDDIHVVGYVDEATKWDMLAAATAFVLPSRLESLSMVVLESWWSRRPVLVHARCEPVVGQVRRARGGLWYDGYGEFAESVGKLSEDAALRDALGDAGEEYVRRSYAWPVVETKYLDLLAEIRFSS
ncbi:MAG: glycosyltransferase family 4 protein [Candidatus Limnocylindria bacterium]